MTPLGDASRRKILSSWKEIAARLGVTVRTAQRWEKTAGLPVHRKGVGRTGRIYARADELERWVVADRARVAREDLAEEPVRRPVWHIYVAALLALAVAAGVTVWKADLVAAFRVPAAWKMEAHRLVVLDSRSRLCWERDLSHLKPNDRVASEMPDRVLIADIDDDGQPEVLFNFFPDDLANRRSSLMCFDARGRLRWEYRYGEPKTFGGRYFEPTYQGRLIRQMRIGNRPLLLTVANHYIWYPAQIALLDPRTGRIVEEYWHPGAVYECSVADLDGDGDTEAVFGAINNPGQGIGRAAVGILKFPLRRFSTPVPPDDPFAPVTGGGELRYVLLPTPDVSEVLSVLPVIQELRVHPQRIFVRAPLAEAGAVIYYLDYQLRLMEQRFSDNFAAVHQRLFVQHLLDHRLTSRETDALARVAAFRAAPDGNSPALKAFWKH